MIKSFIRRLIHSESSKEKILKDSEKNDNFRANAEIDENQVSKFKLEKGEIKTVFAPDLNNQKGLVLTKWHCKPGDIVKFGDMICDIENEYISMEFETVYSGEIVAICDVNKSLHPKAELFKIKGI